jgi:hypothetical protein
MGKQKVKSQVLFKHLIGKKKLKSAEKLFKDEFIQYFRRNFIRALLCFCSVRFPISYARLKGFSSYQQDFFGQYMIHTAR